MKNIQNPFLSAQGYNCFGCSPENKEGLKLTFKTDNEYIYADWLPEKKFEGYPGVLHGGIQSTLLDEIASWNVYALAGTGGVTAKIELKFKKPVPSNKGKIKLSSKIIDINKKIAKMEVRLFSPEGNLCTHGHIDYFIFPPDYAQDKLLYPGKDKFYED